MLLQPNTIETKYGPILQYYAQVEELLTSALKTGEQEIIWETFRRRMQTFVEGSERRLGEDLSRLIKANSNVERDPLAMARLQRYTGLSEQTLDRIVFRGGYEGIVTELAPTVKILDHLGLELTLIATPMFGSASTAEIRQRFTGQKQFQKEITKFMTELLKDVPSISELADFLNLRESTIKDCLNGRVSPSMNNLIRIAAARGRRIHVQVHKAGA